MKSAIVELSGGINPKRKYLSSHENQILDIIKHRANITDAPIHNYQDLKTRMQLLIGELGANNDSKVIKNELSQILNCLLAKKLITSDQAIETTKKYILKH
jgi:hypothetical protein